MVPLTNDNGRIVFANGKIVAMSFSWYETEEYLNRFIYL